METAVTVRAAAIIEEAVAAYLDYYRDLGLAVRAAIADAIATGDEALIDAAFRYGLDSP
jgi:hypothetical protein